MLPPAPEDSLTHGFRQGAEVVRPPFDYPIAGPNSTPWAAGAAGANPGTLGESPPAYLGLFDTRPQDGVPQKTSSLQLYNRSVTPVNGYRGDLQVVGSLPVGGDVNASSQPDGVGWVSPFSDVALSVLVAGFETLDQAEPFAPPTGVVPLPTAPANVGWEPLRIARYGPNVMQELAQTGGFNVSLPPWARGQRFIAAWIWAYWVSVDLPTPATVRVGVLNSCPQPRTGVVTEVSTPVRTVPDGPLAITRANAAGRVGLVPAPSARALQRWGIVNGGPSDVAIEVRYLVGPHPDLTLFAGTADNQVIVPNETAVRVALREGHTAAALWATNNAGTGALGGPLIVSWAAGG